MVRAALASTHVIRVSGFGRAIDFGISDLVMDGFWFQHELGLAIQLAGGDLLDDLLDHRIGISSRDDHDPAAQEAASCPRQQSYANRRCRARSGL